MNICNIPDRWDLVVIGGGITGAGIFREAVRMGIRVLLVERVDYAWGTSSRSSKLVHGGLRYLKEGKILLTKASVEERERLLEEAPGLVEILGFLMPVYKDQNPGRTALSAGLTLYDMMARGHGHEFLETQEFCMMLPHVKEQGLTGGFHFYDAKVDDARLVLRLITEAVASGGTALNYTEATEILRNGSGNVSGLIVHDTEKGNLRELSTSAIVNATGSWAEGLHPSPDEKRHLRPLRGSHLVFPHWTLPVAQAVALIHPDDHRPVFVIPWEGAVLVGTTDLDHDQDMIMEPAITEEEISYLMKAIEIHFPSLDISIDGCIASFAGIRPVLSEGKLPPSEESRDHVVWIDKGLVTITGGKLTTFRRMAWDALDAVKAFLPPLFIPDRTAAVFLPPPDIPGIDSGLSRNAWKRIFGRYGAAALSLVRTADPKDLREIPGTMTLWAELPFVARQEQIRHLSDLLLRRVRIGILVRDGGKEYLDRIQELCEPILPWNKNQWKTERARYLDTIRRFYSLPHRKPIIEEKHEVIPFLRRLWMSLQHRGRTRRKQQ